MLSNLKERRTEQEKVEGESRKQRKLLLKKCSLDGRPPAVAESPWFCLFHSLSLHAGKNKAETD